MHDARILYVNLESIINEAETNNEALTEWLNNGYEIIQMVGLEYGAIIVVDKVQHSLETGDSMGLGVPNMIPNMVPNMPKEFMDEITAALESEQKDGEDLQV